MEEQKTEEQSEEKPKETKEETKPKTREKKPFNLRNFYDKSYKKLLIIPFLLLFLAILSITLQTIRTGDFINRDVTLKGGLTVTIPLEGEVDILELQNHLSQQFTSNDISIRRLKSAGSDIGIIIDSDIDGTKKSETDSLITKIEKKLDIKLEKGEYTVEFIGSSLGASFFKEIFKALYGAFLFMGMVVFLYFGKELKYKIISVILTIIAVFSLLFGTNIITEMIAYIIGIVLISIYIAKSIPSIAVILAALSDIIITLAIVNVMGIKISTAGIAAFLMLIGYSVDTDILLSTRLLKRKEGTEMDRIIGAFKTGITMTLTTLVAVTVAIIFTESEVIHQIMTILLIGLIIDLINTWIQNVGILRLYLERKHKKPAKNEEA